MTQLLSQITLRPATAVDGHALIRLAALDSAPGVPAAPLLVAEIDGQLSAALSLHDGSVIADPFRPTADIVALLRAHVAALRPTPRRRPRRGLQARPRLSPARG